jgi:putative phosphoribosyl transferase
MSSRKVEIPAGEVRLPGALTAPEQPAGIVVFAHGSGSGRESPRNRAVADALVEAGFATLLIDLLTEAEAAEDLDTGRWRFDVGLLGRRVVASIDWLAGDPELGALPVGCFGASTGAAAALIAAAERGERVAAVVSRGGRPDLAADVLSRVAAPTLLIAGGDDPQIVDVSHQAAAVLSGRVETVSGAGHLFEEPGALERVADLTVSWFATHVSRNGVP